MTKVNLKKLVYLTVLLTFAASVANAYFPGYDLFRYGFIALLISLVIQGLSITYEKWGWKYHFPSAVFSLFGFQRYPNIEGNWELKYFSSYEYDWENSQYTQKGTGLISIEKEDGGFFYSGEFGGSSSFKSSHNFVEKNRHDKKEWKLGYVYANIPNDTDVAGTGFVGHAGFALLTYDERSPNKIVGFYGNDEDRKTRGKLILTRA